MKELIKRASALSMALIMSVSIVGCGTLRSEVEQAVKENVGIKLSIDDSVDNKTDTLTWIEVGQLDTFSELRREWDDVLGVIKFESGSKNGPIYIDLDGNWNGNTIVKNIFQNKVFYREFWTVATEKSKLAQCGVEEFSDISNEGTGILAALNAYFNILPVNEDKTSGLFNKLSRKEVMAAVLRGDTEVTYLEENENFNNIVGKTDYNVYASQLDGSCYFNTSNNSLNAYTYNSAMTRGEVIYLLVQRYFKEDYDSLTNLSNNPFNDCKNAGDLLKELGLAETDNQAQVAELEWSLQHLEEGCPEDMYKALLVAYNKGLLRNETRWSEPVIYGEVLNWMISCYNTMHTTDQFAINAKTGENIGTNLVVKVETPKETPKEVASFGDVTVTTAKDVTDLDDLFDVYGDEIDISDAEEEEVRMAAEGYTFEPCDFYTTIDHCSWLNVRVGPSTDFRIIGSKPVGTKTHVVAYCVETGWYRVIIDKQIAYQSNYYFSEQTAAEAMGN